MNMLEVAKKSRGLTTDRLDVKEKHQNFMGRHTVSARLRNLATKGLKLP